jgi:tetratricopeptide (TPR) repeat protein
LKITFFCFLLYLLFSPAFAEKDPLEIAYNVGLMADYRGDTGNAKVIFEDLISKTSKYPIAFFELGKIYFHEGDERAEECFKNSLNYSKNNNKLKLVNLIMLSYATEENNQKAAFKYAKQAYEVDSNDPDAKFVLGNAYYRRGLKETENDKMEEAILDFEKSLIYIKNNQLIKNGIVSSYLLLVENSFIKFQRNKDSIQNSVFLTRKNTLCPKIKTLLEQIKGYKFYENNLRRFNEICNE